MPLEAILMNLRSLLPAKSGQFYECLLYFKHLSELFKTLSPTKSTIISTPRWVYQAVASNLTVTESNSESWYIYIYLQYSCLFFICFSFFFSFYFILFLCIFFFSFIFSFFHFIFFFFSSSFVLDRWYTYKTGNINSYILFVLSMRTFISLCIRRVWSVFAERMKKLWVLNYP